MNHHDPLTTRVSHFGSAQLADLRQRKQTMLHEKEQAEMVRKKAATLESMAQNLNDHSVLERQRLKIEQRRLELELQRLEAEELDRSMQRERAELVRQLRNLIADGTDSLLRLRKEYPLQ